MKPVKLMLLSVVCATLALASAAIANAASSPIGGVTYFKAIGGGADTSSACTLTTPPFTCANGDSQGASDCSCTEYVGAMKGSGVGSGIMTLDLVMDTSGQAGSFITIPAPGGALTCYATVGVGLMQQDRILLPILLFTVGGYACPGSGVVPNSLSGSYTIINPELGTLSIPSKYPNASGSGAFAGQSSNGNITFSLTGDLKRN